MRTMYTTFILALVTTFVVGAGCRLFGPTWNLSVDEVKVLNPAVGCIACYNRRVNFRITGSGAIHYEVWFTDRRDTERWVGSLTNRRDTEDTERYVFARSGPFAPIHMPFRWHHSFHAFREENADQRGFTITFVAWDTTTEQDVTFTYEGG